MKRRIVVAAAVAALALTGCGGEPDADLATGHTEPTAIQAEPSESDPAEPEADSGIQVSGDFEADLERYAGLTDEDVEGVDSFREYLREGLCETDLDPERMGPAAFKVMVERYGDPDATWGIHPDVVRLVIAYDCSERMELAEQYLEDIGA